MKIAIIGIMLLGIIFFHTNLTMPIRNIKLFTFISFLTFFLTNNSFAAIVSPEDIITEKQEALFFENRLGIIEVGETSKKRLQFYTGEGLSIKKQYSGEKIYYLDKKNNLTLIIETDYRNIIEVAILREGLIYPPWIKNPKEIEFSKKINLKYVTTSKGIKVGSKFFHINNSYAKPSVEIIGRKYKSLKYIMLGSLHSNINFVYLEYSFMLKNDKVIQIKIENSR